MWWTRESWCVMLSSLVSEEEAGRARRRGREEVKEGGRRNKPVCSDTCCSFSPALQINSYRAERCSETWWVHFLLFSRCVHTNRLLAPETESVWHFSGWQSLMWTIRQLMQVFSIFKESDRRIFSSLMHARTRTNTHTQSERGRRINTCTRTRSNATLDVFAAAPLLLTVLELSAVPVLKRLVTSHTAAVRSLQCKCLLMELWSSWMRFCLPVLDSHVC